MSFSYCRLLFILLLSFVAILQAEELEEHLFLGTVVNVQGFVVKPDRGCNYWRSYVVCQLDNGLVGTAVDYFLHESQAEDDVGYQMATLQGRVYINNNLSSALYSSIYYDLYLRHKSPQDYSLEDMREMNTSEFYLICLDHSHVIELNLAISEEKEFDTLPQLVSIQETETAISHWFYTEYKYSYLLELSDGSFWEATRKAKWDNSADWEVNSHILIMGKSKDPCMINVDAFKRRKHVYIEQEDLLNHYFENIKRVN